MQNKITKLRCLFSKANKKQCKQKNANADPFFIFQNMIVQVRQNIKERTE